MFQCSNVPIISAHDWYIGCLYQSWAQIIGTLVHWYIGSWVVLCTSHGPKSLVHWYIGTLVHWYIGTLVHWVLGRPLHQSWAQIVGTLVHWFVAALALSVNPKPSAYVCRVYALHEKVELLPSPCRYMILIAYPIEKVEREGRYSQTIKLGSI